MPDGTTAKVVADAPAPPLPNRALGLLFAGVCGIVAAFALWRGRDSGYAWLAGGAGFAAVALLVPHRLAPLTRLWLRFGELLHRIVNPVILTLLFFGAFMPTGLMLRLLRRDPLRLRRDRSAETYWIIRTPPGPAPQTMRQQF